MKFIVSLGSVVILASFIAGTTALCDQPDKLATDQAIFKSLTAQASSAKGSPIKGNNGVGNGIDPAPPGSPPVNDGPGTGPGNPGNKGPKP